MRNGTSQIVAYNEFRAQLGELKAFNEQAVFDYEDAKGNKEARSHVYKLRQTKAAVDKVRKDEKAASLEYGRQVDAQAKEIVGEIESMIAVHQRPLDEIEQRESDRKAALEARIEKMRELATESNEDVAASQLKQRLADLESYSLGDHWQEFEIEAARVKERGAADLKARITKRETYEAEQSELARLRREQAAREQQERDERISREAEQRATEAAEKRAQVERDAAERRELQLRLAAETSERERIEADQRAARAAHDAEERIRKEAADEAARAKADQESREANKRHVAKVKARAVEALVAVGVTPETARLVIDVIGAGKVPYVKIEV